MKTPETVITETNEVSLDEQIKCVGRELGMRKNFYPKWVAQNRMTQKKADEEIGAMEAVYNTLKELKGKREK